MSGEVAELRFGRYQAELCIPKKGHIAATIRRTKTFYEPELLAALQRLRCGGTYVDVGAHIGNHSVCFAECCRAASVIAVEPLAANLVYLRRNAAMPRRVQIAVHPLSLGAEGDTLDTLTDGIDDVTVVKIDVGPGAADVVRGAEQLLTRCRPVLAVEAASPTLYEEVNKLLSAHGYVVKGVYNPTATYLFTPVEVVVNVITYNRPLYLARLLKDLGRSPAFATVRVYEDASTVDMGRSLKVVRERGWYWHRFKHNHGKRGFWSVVTRVMQDARTCAPGTMFVWLPDDVRLCEDFIAEALACWNAVADNKRVALNLQAEKYRDKVPCWTGFEPKRAGERLWQTQWVDGVMLCGHAALNAVDYCIPEPPAARWRTPNISSGVWRHFSLTLHKAGLGIYRTHQSLVAHVRAPSVMHEALRQKEPLTTTRFKGGEAKHTRLVTAEPICGSLASIPSRVDNLQRVVTSLIGQVDVLRVYLNGYDEVPKFLKRKRVAVVISQRHGDRGDAGKFFWCEKARGYQLTCDDDLIYPQGYATLMVAAIERYGRSAVVGLHGIRIEQPVQKSYYAERKLLHWRESRPRDTCVHLLGTGCLGYHASALALKRSAFEAPNMADVWMGLACQQAAVPMVCIAHEAKYLKHLHSPWTIYQRDNGKDGVQTAAVGRINSWRCHLKGKK